MRHFYIDAAAAAVDSWCAAFPRGKVLEAGAIASVGELAAVFWVRCRPGAIPFDIFTRINPVPGRVVVALADEPDESLIARLLEAGVAGCCNTHAAPSVLKQVALVVQNGGLWVGPNFLRRVVGGVSQALQQKSVDPVADAWVALLSEREVQVARLVAGGASNREIADALSITERTVKAHLSAIFDKLEVRDRLQLSLCVNGLRV